MSAAISSDRRALLCDSEPPKKMTRPVIAGIGLAVIIHAGLALYIINERFEIIVPPAPPEVVIKGTTITLDKPKPKPVPTEQKPVQQTTVKIHNPVNVPDTVTDTIPVTPAPPDVIVGPVTGPVISLQGEPAKTPQQGVATGPVYAKAVWSRFPDSAVLMEYYPARALNAEMEGSATVSCEIIDTKGRVACVAMNESPAGYGFGRATIRAVEAKGRADTTSGNLRIGDVMLVKLSWTLQ
ncbi:MAG: hypothetical protein QM645_11540 [Asticcacaulis sp.]